MQSLFATLLSSLTLNSSWNCLKDEAVMAYLIWLLDMMNAPSMSTHVIWQPSLCHSVYIASPLSLWDGPTLSLPFMLTLPSLLNQKFHMSLSHLSTMQASKGHLHAMNYLMGPMRWLPKTQEYTISYGNTSRTFHASFSAWYMSVAPGQVWKGYSASLKPS